MFIILFCFSCESQKACFSLSLNSVKVKIQYNANGRMKPDDLKAGTIPNYGFVFENNLDNDG